MRRLLLAVPIALVAVALAAPATAGNSWTDPTGDSNGAPDITGVVVANDAAGNVAFGVAIVSHPTIGSDEWFNLWIDSDQNPATGSGGADYLLQLDGSGWGLFRWDGSQWAQVTSHGAIAVQYVATGFAMKINKADLGNAASFNFWVTAEKGPGDSTDVLDSAPDGTAVYSYTLTTPTLTGVDVLVKPASARNGVHPGSTLTIATTRAVLDDGSKVEPDAATCTATAAGRRLSPVGACSFRIPKAAHGKSVAISVTVRYAGQAVTARFTFRVLKR